MRGNRSYPDSLRQYVVQLVRNHYHDFGPTLVAEKLQERHQIDLSAETIRLWLADAENWKRRRERKKQVHQPRNRRECYGELIWIDGSEHRWFEGRGPKWTLLVYIDDATSKLMELRFCDSESTFDYFHSTKRYLEQHGKTVAFYSDKHSVFRVNNKKATGSPILFLIRFVRSNKRMWSPLSRSESRA